MTKQAPESDASARRLTSTAFEGLLVLLPLAIIAILVLEVYALLEETAAFAQLELPFPGFINALIYIAVVLAVMFLLCLLVGLSLQTGPGRRFANFVEQSITAKIPFLGLMRNLTASLASGSNGAVKAGEADLQGNGTCVLGLLMETLPDGRQVIFVPSAPAVTLGSIHIVAAERVRFIEGSVASLATAVSQWGVGTTEALQPPETPSSGKD